MVIHALEERADGLLFRQARLGKFGVRALEGLWVRRLCPAANIVVKVPLVDVGPQLVPLARGREHVGRNQREKVGEVTRVPD